MNRVAARWRSGLHRDLDYPTLGTCSRVLGKSALSGCDLAITRDYPREPWVTVVKLLVMLEYIRQ